MTNPLHVSKCDSAAFMLNQRNFLGIFTFQATVLCDIIVMYLLKRGAFYKEKKYQVIATRFK